MDGLENVFNAALSRMIERGLDDHTVMSVSGHSSTRMVERYTHPTVERKRAALETFDSLAKIGHQNRRTMPYKEKSRPKTTFS